MNNLLTQMKSLWIPCIGSFEFEIKTQQNGECLEGSSQCWQQLSQRTVNILTGIFVIFVKLDSFKWIAKMIVYLVFDLLNDGLIYLFVHLLVII